MITELLRASALPQFDNHSQSRAASHRFLLVFVIRSFIIHTATGIFSFHSLNS